MGWEKFAESAGRALGTVIYKYKKIQIWVTPLFDHCVAPVIAPCIWVIRTHTKLDRTFWGVLA